jgi:hypothetical protein
VARIADELPIDIDPATDGNRLSTTASGDPAAGPWSDADVVTFRLREDPPVWLQRALAVVRRAHPVQQPGREDLRGHAAADREAGLVAELEMLTAEEA